MGEAAQRIRPASIMSKSREKPAPRNGDRKTKERTAAWFAGFLPADQPRYAFAAVYEGEVGSKVHGGSAAAPMIADVFKDVYKGQMLTSRSQRREREQPEIRRAEPVEENDESD